MNGIYTSAEGARAVERSCRALLERWPVPAEHLRVPTRQGETFVVACGPRDAPPVLLLHGSGASSAMWMEDVAAWSRHLRLYAVDTIGEPGLSAPSRPALDSDAHALWLDDVLAALAVRRVSIVGTSLGGRLAVDYATRRPGRVARLALLCPSGIGGQKYGVLLLALLLMPFGRWGRDRTMRLVLGPAASSASPAPDASSASAAAAASSASSASPEPPPPSAEPMRAYGEHVMLVHEHFRPRRERIPVFDDDTLRRLSMPVLVTVGGRDALLDSHETRRRLEAAVPHATVRLLPDAGHLLRGQTLPILDFLSSREEGPAVRESR
ncbi:alpha/beta hydrolase [Streptosporangium sp. NPDC023825]|uniref:alpha/beta fold hydrolase n=1 Tax=Streptosporangium sp. NPDC023825 TaxID=3154909 RepID=UPI00343D33E3